MKTSWQKLLKPRGQNISQKKKKGKGVREGVERDTHLVSGFCTILNSVQKRSIFRSTNVTGIDLLTGMDAILSTWYITEGEAPSTHLETALEEGRSLKGIFL